MVTLEQVEKLRERANVSFEEAKIALEQAGGDLLDALILLERQGKTAPPPSGGYYSGEQTAEPGQEPETGVGNAHRHGSKANSTTFSDVMNKICEALANIFNAGSTNYIDAYKNDRVVLSCPVIVFVILLIVAFWVTIPLLFIGLICGWRYKLRGPDLGSDTINDVIQNAEDAVEDFKNSVVESAQNAKAGHEAKKAENNSEKL